MEDLQNDKKEQKKEQEEDVKMPGEAIGMLPEQSNNWLADEEEEDEYLSDNRNSLLISTL